MWRSLYWKVHQLKKRYTTVGCGGCDKYELWLWPPRLLDFPQYVILDALLLCAFANFVLCRKVFHISQKEHRHESFFFVCFFEMHLPHMPFQIMRVSAYLWALSAKKFLCCWLLFCSYKCSKPNVWFYLLHHLGRSRRIFCLVTLLMPRQFFLIWKQFSTLRTSLCCFWLFFLCAVCFDCVSIQIMFKPCFIVAQCASAKG